MSLFTRLVFLGLATWMAGPGLDVHAAMRAEQKEGTPPVDSATVSATAPVAVLAHLQGRVLVREAGIRKLRSVEEGHALAPDVALISGDATRYEVRPTEGGGLWRVGRRAVFSLQAVGTARLWAGTAFALVPAGAEWRVESRRSVVLLPEGSWLVQAVDNQGLKIVCLDGSAPLRALGLPGAPTASAATTVKLRPGELAFLQPGGETFSPPVTIFLEETLATSRLINGFPEPPPGMRRLVNQAIAQRERLKGVSNAVIVGAAAAGGFQIAVPDPDAKRDGASSLNAEPQPDGRSR